MWEMLVSGLNICFLRHVSNVAWVDRGEILSILKSIGAVGVRGPHPTLSVGRGSIPWSHNSSGHKQGCSCFSGIARCDSGEK